MRRRTHNPEDAIGGQDSFLDIVANLVGILIILVVIVSAQARSASNEIVAADDLNTRLTEKQTELKRIRRRVTKMTVDNHQLEKDIIEEKRLAKALADERHAKLMMLERARQRIELETAEWESYRKQDFEAQVKITDLKQQLTSIQNEVAAWENRETEINRVELIEHFPTPIAQTVFTEEVHFRLSGGRISYVPLEELVDQMKAQWKVVAEELKNTNQTISTVGPLNDYRLQYKLIKRSAESDGSAGAISREIIKFDRFIILPAVDELGESVDEQLLADSQFLRQLASRRPEKTTVSIWVYPDSFGKFLTLKNYLHERGFQVASWPLEFGRPISGGPNGFKTSAQ